jgi:hypothetical protein
MFWKESKGLGGLHASSKIAITLFLLIAGLGYLLGFLNILLSYSPVDQKPGLSIDDVRISFWGARQGTKLEKSIDGTMKQYFASPDDHSKVKAWLTAGSPQADFETVVKPVFDASCTTCHSPEAAVAGVVLSSFEEVQTYLAQDTGKSVSRLVSLSHTHVLATLPVIFILAFIFSFTRFSEKLKAPLMAFSFLAIVLDIGSWWLAKASGSLAALVLVGGVSLALSFLLLIVSSLWDMWIVREP